MASLSAFSAQPEHYECVSVKTGEALTIVQHRENQAFIANDINATNWTQIERTGLSAANPEEGGYIGIYSLGGDRLLYIPGNFQAFDETKATEGKVQIAIKNGQRFGVTYINKIVETFSCELIPIAL